MFTDTRAFASFAVDDLDAARRFYGETLGLRTSTPIEGMLLALETAGGVPTLVYLKSDFVPATYTVFNFAVDDVEAAVDELAARGVECERYEGFEQDEKGIATGDGPPIAWFKDPAGNILSVVRPG
ncbi:MAG: VOC family protein [Solirubrobacterales bacterium]